LVGKEALGLIDDAAIIPAENGMEYVITKDALIEGVHFLVNTSPADLAYKIMGVNLSDLAAMGATPKYYLCAACFNDSIDENWIKEFTIALGEIQRQYGIMLIGGDTTRHKGAPVFSITMMGEVPTGKALLRSGAKVGDDIWVSGIIGEAADFTSIRYLRPEPRIELGLKLRDIASACVDVSDGLVADIGHIATASNVKIILQADAIPIANIPLEQAITSGDDYELAFTAAPDKADVIGKLATRIGKVEAGSGIVVLDAQSKPITLLKKGYTHF
jgi:thiamine-monophosphate kinase